MGVFSFDPTDGEAMLQSYHPGTTVEQIEQQTGWQLRLAPDCRETVLPSDNELRLIRACDPHGVWTRV
jgi:glutaconate CoA-transferase subunit B